MTTFAAKMCEKNRYMVSVRAVSVLIPTFNCVCLELVEGLCRLLEKAAGEKSVDGFEYEIIVADDGSTDAASVEANRPIASLPHCQYIVRPENQGRAAIRNFLAQTARFDYLLFIDSDMSLVSDQYISRYLSVEEHSVIDGGVAICGDSETGRGNRSFPGQENSKGNQQQRQRGNLTRGAAYIGEQRMPVHLREVRDGLRAAFVREAERRRAGHGVRGDPAGPVGGRRPVRPL